MALMSRNQVLASLKGTFEDGSPERRVTPVALFSNPGLNLPRDKVRIFIPDFHLLTRKDNARYPRWGFQQEEHLTLLMESLVQLKIRLGDELEVYHMGDLVDLWRAPEGNLYGKIQAVVKDYPKIMGLLQDGYGETPGLGATLIFGNHDHGRHKKKAKEWRAKPQIIEENSEPDGGEILITHGDVFSFWQQIYPKFLGALAVQIKSWHESPEKDPFDKAWIEKPNPKLDKKGLKNHDRAIGVNDQPLQKFRHYNLADVPGVIENVVSGNAGPRTVRRRFYKRARSVSEAWRSSKKGKGDRPRDVRLVVVAHTHFARIVAGTTKNQKPFVLMDTGGWLGKAYTGADDSSPRIFNGQLGILSGDDLGVYQFGHREAPVKASKKGK